MLGIKASNYQISNPLAVAVKEMTAFIRRDGEGKTDGQRPMD